MTIVGNAPGLEARDPRHPAHAQWVKDQMLQRETAWLRSRGDASSSRIIELEVHRGMERLYARKREKQLRRSRKRAERSRAPIGDAMARDAGYKFRKHAATTSLAAPLGTASAMSCRACGQCRRCRREGRVRAIIQQGTFDRLVTRVRTRYVEWAERIANTVVRCQLGRGEFEHLGSDDRDRVITHVIEQVCDESTGCMGAWR